jgi:hypothetical protein
MQRPTTYDQEESSTHEQSVVGINFFLEFLDPQVAEDYKSFKIANSSFVLLAITTVVLTGTWVAYWILVFRVIVDVFTVMTMVISGFPIVLLWLLVLMKSLISVEDQIGEYRQNFTNIESLIIIGISISTSLVLVMRSVNGPCVSDTFTELWYCSPFFSFDTLPSDIVYTTLTFPLFFEILLPFVEFHTVIFSFGISLSVVLFSVVYFHAQASIAIVIEITLITAAIGICYRQQHIQLYLAADRYQQLLRLRQQDFGENAERLREGMSNVLSSVCHDMKSVSVNKFDHLNSSDLALSF